jgi:hypothetical protein
MRTTDTGANEALVAYSFELDKRTEVRAYMQPYKGQLLAHLRRFRRSDDLGEFRPEKGIAVPVDRLPQLLIAAALLVAHDGERDA